jgi:adenine-specific DNA-methyltransferase
VTTSLEELEIVRDALACGAAACGGPLSAAELALVRAAGRPATEAGRTIRARIRDGGDPLGERLCAARSRSQRRTLGAFYTSPTIVEAMLDWVLDRRVERLVDPGCGSGRFAVAAAKRNRALALVAVDVDPLATLMTRAALAAVGAANSRVRNDDYLFTRIEPIAGRTAFVGNPPYVRHHELTPAVKERASALASDIGSSISGLAGLHVLFYLATLALHAKRGDAGSFVTSAEWLDVRYGAFLRNAFAGELGGRGLAAFDPRATPFAGAMTTAAITTFSIGSATRCVTLSQLADGAAISLRRGRRYERSALARAPRWSAFLRGTQERDETGRIGTLFRVSRGQVTGANGFFVMSKACASERGILRYCIPLVSSAKEVIEANGTVHDAPHRLVGLQIGSEADILADEALADYVRAGEAAQIHRGYVASRRRPWYAVVFPRPPIVGTYMARRAPCFARNPDGLGLLNVVHGLYPRRPLDERALEHVVASLNAERASFVGKGRTYHGGLEKFEPREMEALQIDLSV